MAEKESKQKQTEQEERQSVEANGVIENTQTIGWLYKRRKMSSKWEKRWFELKGIELLYGNSEGVTTKKIPLTSAEISESSLDGKQYGFRLKPKDSKRTYYLHAESEEDQHNWMQAICFAKATGGHDKSEACSLQ